MIVDILQVAVLTNDVEVEIRLSARALPIPRLAPVTRATGSSDTTIVLLSGIRVGVRATHDEPRAPAGARASPGHRVAVTH